MRANRYHLGARTRVGWKALEHAAQAAAIEAHGPEAGFSCREGNCGTSRTKLIEGDVAYIKQPTARIDADEVLLCCAVPADQEGGLQLDVASGLMRPA
jgi:ferredoxin